MMCENRKNSILHYRFNDVLLRTQPTCPTVTYEGGMLSDVNGWSIDEPVVNCYRESVFSFLGSRRRFGAIQLSVQTKDDNSLTVVQFSSSIGCSFVLYCSGLEHQIAHRA